jgi:hypothetical protein
VSKALTAEGGEPVQHYLHVGFGLPGALIPAETADRIWDDYDGVDEGGQQQTRVRFISFTEDYEGGDWGTLVLQDFGEVPGHGAKLLSLSQAAALGDKYQLTPKRREHYKALLTAYGLESLIEKVELVFFSDNY